MKKTALHIILSCTNRKRIVGEAYPRLRDVVADTVEQRAAGWIERVSAAPASTVARDLYAGEYWRGGLDLAEHAGRFFVSQTWILSAGLGLIGANELVPAYAATFTSGHPDSVATPPWEASAIESRRRWWAAIAEWKGPGSAGSPRRISDLASNSSAIVVCAGRDYLTAIASDLSAAWMLVGERGLVIFGSGLPEAGMESAWVQVPGQLRLALGGSMSSTGVRAATAVIDELGPSGRLDADDARRLVGSWVKSVSPLPRFERKRLADDEVVEWIRSDLDTHGPSTSKSIALRRFRDGGLACEQGRFGRLYERAVQGRP